MEDLIDGKRASKAGDFRRGHWRGKMIRKIEEDGDPTPARLTEAVIAEHNACMALLGKCGSNNVQDHPDKRTGVMARVWG